MMTKKQRVCLILSIALCICSLLFSGCSAAPGSTVLKGGESSASLSAVSGEPVDPEIPIEEPEDFFSKYGQTQLPDPQALPSYLTATEQPYLYRCPFTLPPADGSSILTEGETLVLSYWLDGNRVRMYSLETGALLRELLLTDSVAVGLTASGDLWCVEYDGLGVTFYGKDGSGADDRILREADNVHTGEHAPYSASVSADGRWLLYLSEGSARMTLCNLETGAETSLEMPKGSGYPSFLDTADGFLLSSWGDWILTVDPEAGTVEQQTVDGSIWSYENGLLHYASDDGLLLGGTDVGAQHFYMAFSSSDEWMNEVAFGCAATLVYDTEFSARFYDLREGVLLAALPVGADCYQLGTYWLEDGRVLLSLQMADRMDCFLYDLPAVKAAEEPVLQVETLLCTDGELWEKIALMAAEAEEANGVELFYASEGNDFSIWEYVGVAELDPITVYRSVKTAAEILSLYPEGMLRESYAETNKGLRIYLCGTLHGVDGSGLSQAGGVTTESEGYIVIALDINNNLSYNLPHELSHVLDRRITYVAEQGGRDWLSLWEALTPFADAYTGTYGDYLNNAQYTASYETDANRIWFVDDYSRTYPTEDRARIMEHLFNPEGDGLASVLQAPHLQYKARFYCYMLRQCFPSCDGADVLYWEAQLGTVNETEFADLLS